MQPTLYRQDPLQTFELGLTSADFWSCCLSLQGCKQLGVCQVHSRAQPALVLAQRQVVVGRAAACWVPVQAQQGWLVRVYGQLASGAASTRAPVDSRSSVYGGS
jgi:hypothetical protein